jgi:hypothetical protein
MEDAFESDALAASKPPKLNELLTPPQRKAYPFLEQDNPEQKKGAEVFTPCKAFKVCNGKYTDARDSGGDGKKNFGVCSKTCRATKKAPRKCDHGRQKAKCRDCGTG